MLRCLFVSALALTTISLASAGPVSSADKRNRSSLERWHSFYDTRLAPGERLCEIQAHPLGILTGPPVTSNTVAFIYVTLFKQFRYALDVSIVLGFEPRFGSRVSASIDDLSFDLAVTKKTAKFRVAKLASTQQVDAFIRAMRDGEYLTITGLDQSGQSKARVYTLEGVEESIQDVMGNCLREPDVGLGKYRNNRSGLKTKGSAA